jgi:hypothetical protein
VYVDTKFGDIEGKVLTAKEAVGKYGIEGGEERVKQIVEGIDKGIEERLKVKDKGTKFLKRIVENTPKYIKAARERYNKAKSM